MAPDHTLRPATSSDTEVILVVHVAAIIAHGPAAYTAKQVAAWAAKADGTDRYTDAISDSTVILVVAEVDGRIVGVGELDTDRGEVTAIFVDPEWNGEGIGSSILRCFEHRLRDQEFEAVCLRAVLNAVEFYEQHGYERERRTGHEHDHQRRPSGIHLDGKATLTSVGPSRPSVRFSCRCSAEAHG